MAISCILILIATNREHCPAKRHGSESDKSLPCRKAHFALFSRQMQRTVYLDRYFMRQLDGSGAVYREEGARLFGLPVDTMVLKDNAKWKHRNA